MTEPPSSSPGADRFAVAIDEMCADAGSRVRGGAWFSPVDAALMMLFQFLRSLAAEFRALSEALRVDPTADGVDRDAAPKASPTESGPGGLGPREQARDEANSPTGRTRRSTRPSSNLEIAVLSEGPAPSGGVGARPEGRFAGGLSEGWRTPGGMLAISDGDGTPKDFRDRSGTGFRLS